MPQMMLHFSRGKSAAAEKINEPNVSAAKTRRSPGSFGGRPGALLELLGGVLELAWAFWEASWGSPGTSGRRPGDLLDLLNGVLELSWVFWEASWISPQPSGRRPGDLLDGLRGVPGVSWTCRQTSWDAPGRAPEDVVEISCKFWEASWNSSGSSEGRPGVRLVLLEGVLETPWAF